MGQQHDPFSGVYGISGSVSFKDGSSSGSPYTYYLGPRIRDFTDERLSETFLAVEAGEEMAVPWTKPDDLEFNPLDPLGTMGLNPDDTFMALMADGSARVISAGEVEAALSALITQKAAKSFTNWLRTQAEFFPESPSPAPKITVSSSPKVNSEPSTWCSTNRAMCKST